MRTRVVAELRASRIEPLHAGLKGTDPQRAILGLGHAANDTIGQCTGRARGGSMAADHTHAPIDDVDTVLCGAGKHAPIAQLEHAEQVRVTEFPSLHRTVAQHLDGATARIVSLQAATPRSDPQQPGIVDQQGTRGIEAEAVRNTGIVDQQMTHSKRVGVDDGDAEPVTTEPDFIIRDLRHRIDPRLRQFAGACMFSADPADRTCFDVDARRTVLARAYPQAVVARLHQPDDLAPRK